MIQKITYPVFADTGASKSQQSEEALIIKHITKVRVFGITVYCKEVRTPHYYGHYHYQG